MIRQLRGFKLCSLAFKFKNISFRSTIHLKCFFFNYKLKNYKRAFSYVLYTECFRLSSEDSNINFERSCFLIPTLMLCEIQHMLSSMASLNYNKKLIYIRSFLSSYPLLETDSLLTLFPKSNVANQVFPSTILIKFTVFPTNEIANNLQLYPSFYNNHDSCSFLQT